MKRGILFKMDLFRTQPSLCSLFLSLLQEWGAETLDWSLLRDEVFVDRFLRRLVTSQELEDGAVSQACASLLQPSIGGLLAAPLLLRSGHFQAGEMESFVQFAVRGSAWAWDPMTWSELLTILEDVGFAQADEDKARFLASMTAQGWVPDELLPRFFRRIWQTCRLSLAEKTHFFGWLYGESPWADLPAPVKGTSSDTASLRLASRLALTEAPYSARRIRETASQGRGFSGQDKEAVSR